MSFDLNDERLRTPSEFESDGASVVSPSENPHEKRNVSMQNRRNAVNKIFFIIDSIGFKM